MFNEVKIYKPVLCFKANNAPLALSEVVKPVLDFENLKKFKEHKCKNKKCNVKTTRKFYCSDACSDEAVSSKRESNRAEKQRLEALQPKRYCSNKGCKEILNSAKKKYCSRKCSSDAGRAERHRKAEIAKQKLREIRASGKAIC